MLSSLHIENIAVIERADISFGAGFNVLTGETGAGKSMVIDSILAILGERTYRDIIRTGEKKAVVSALFKDVHSVCADLGEDSDGELLLTREIHADGKNVCRINGKVSALPVLRSIGSRLLNIHGQHDGQKLLLEEHHIKYLDGYAKCDKLLEDYSAAWQKWQSISNELDRMTMDEREKERLIEILNYQINDIDSAELKPGEDERVEARRTLLKSAAKISGNIAKALSALDGDEDNDGAASLLSRAAASLYNVSGFSEDIDKTAEKLEELKYLAEDASAVLDDVLRQMEFSPGELDELESKHDIIYRMKKKYGGSVEAVLEFREKCAAELDGIVFSDKKIAELEREKEEAYNALSLLAAELTEVRKSAAEGLSKDVALQLSGMDMNGVQFCAHMAPLDKLGPNGAESVSFLLSANVGELPRPLARIASGGELSRIMLALQNVLTRDDEAATLIFDEVDAGISGRAAQAVAKKLAALAQNKQVICVTHLPRIASFGTEHFLIEKGTRDGRTYTSVTPLDKEGRKKELVRMTGGTLLTDAALENADELLRSAAEMIKQN